MDESTERPRTAPWSEGGKPVLLVAEPGGALERFADDVERDLLANAKEVAELASNAISKASAEHEVRYIAVRLVEVLRDAVRVAELRGERL